MRAPHNRFRFLLAFVRNSAVPKNVEKTNSLQKLLNLLYNIQFLIILYLQPGTVTGRKTHLRLFKEKFLAFYFTGVDPNSIALVCKNHIIEL
jgi:hypothetical protein